MKSGKPGSSAVGSSSGRRRAAARAPRGAGIGIERLEPRRALAVVPIRLGSKDEFEVLGVPVQCNGISYFRARNVADGSAQADAGIELWRTDDTPAGTFRLKDINAGSASSEPENFLVVGNMLFFTADDGIHGRELWRTDGTAAGTVMVRDINLKITQSSRPDNLTNVGGTLFFTATDGWLGEELWKTDGTATGTVLVKDINPGSESSRLLHLTNLGGSLMFAASDGVHGRELWRSDGTAAGTVLVKDILPDAWGSDPGGGRIHEA